MDYIFLIMVCSGLIAACMTLANDGEGNVFWISLSVFVICILGKIGEGCKSANENAYNTFYKITTDIGEFTCRKSEFYSTIGTHGIRHTEIRKEDGTKIVLNGNYALNVIKEEVKK